MRNDLRIETRVRMTIVGRELSILADENKARKLSQSRLSFKSVEEASVSARKTSPLWNKVGSASKIAGRSLLVVGAGMSVYNIATTPDSQRTKVVVQEATTWTGALAGGAGGAKLGGIVGSFFGPGLGTVIGAAVGGLVGGIGGAIAGSSLGKKIASWF